MWLSPQMRDGTVLVLAVSLLWGITPIMDKVVADRTTPGAIMAIRFTTTFVCILPLYFMSSVRTQLSEMSLQTFFYAIGAAILSAIFGIFLYFMAMKKMEATKVTPICATYPLVTLILGILFLHEQMTLTKIVGTVLAVAGVILISL